MDEVSNPYAVPESILSNQTREIPSEQPLPIYTPFQVRLAAFIGGPFAAVFTLYQNFKQLDDSQGKQLTLALGIGFNVLLIAILPFLPEHFPGQLIPLLYSIAAGGIASSKQLSKDKICESSQYQRRTAWNVTAVIFVSLISFSLIVFPLFILLDHFGIIHLA